MKESFVVRTEWAEQIDLLTDEQAGQLLKAWFKYHMDESVDVHDPVVMMAFSFNRSYFEECASRWAATVQARQEAGKKGGRPKKANGLSEKAKKPNAFLGFEEKAKKAVSVSESVSVSVPPDGGSKARKKKDGSDIEPKVQWAEFVTMTNAEHQRLLDTHGAADTARLIEILDNYKGSTGKTYTSDYRAILSWCVDRLEEEKRKTGEEPEYKWVNGKRRKVTDSDRQAETSAAERTQANMERMRRMLEDMNREDGPCG